MLNSQIEKLEKRVAFDDRTIQFLEGLLQRVVHDVGDLDWKFSEGELTVWGIGSEPITFTHRKSAQAFLDGYLLGYDEGFASGRGVEWEGT